MKLAQPDPRRIRRRVNHMMIFFILSLILSGLTAFPLEIELDIASGLLHEAQPESFLSRWIATVYDGVLDTNRRYPFIAYGTDWLAFAHLILAVLFIGPLNNPSKNIWVVQFGLIACVAVIPMAFIAGSVRGIPVFWRLIDCCFGVAGGVTLWQCHCDIKKLMRLNSNP